ncbi:hypothetical protein [Peribacillus sp. YIM B13477]|uniref:hypothetical protein n=1 Tax=Peribacillus sp. YIM B13477 TaxID=3366300 RepID=UPI0036733FE3
MGTVHFVWWQPEHNSAENGYVLSKEYWGKGLITDHFWFRQYEHSSYTGEMLFRKQGFRAYEKVRYVFRRYK